MKRRTDNFDREKKIHRVVKGTNKVGKHRNSLYNMLSEEDDDFDSEVVEYDLKEIEKENTH